jgi:class 3 adenylate cyclase
MKIPFFKKRPTWKAEKFSGISTVLVSVINNMQDLSNQLCTRDLVSFLGKYIAYVSKIIEKYSGVVFRFDGDTILVFWPPHYINPFHAQLAFDASREIVQSRPQLTENEKLAGYEVAVFLGTGGLSGDYFGPTRQFQIVGDAMSVADRLSNAARVESSSILMSQLTLDLLNHPNDLKEVGIIKRDELEDLRLFRYSIAPE